MPRRVRTTVIHSACLAAARISGSRLASLSAEERATSVASREAQPGSGGGSARQPRVAAWPASWLGRRLAVPCCTGPSRAGRPDACPGEVAAGCRAARDRAPDARMRQARVRGRHSADGFAHRQPELRCRAYREGPADSVTALIFSRVTRMPSRLVRPRANPAIIQYRRMSGVSASSNDSVTSVPPALGSSW